MSEVLPVLESTEQRSSTKLVLNAKGEVQIEVKVRVGDTGVEVAEARTIAEREFDALRRKYRP